jgi:TolB-like protein/Tfp pilus assembly protein PilF
MIDRSIAVLSFENRSNDKQQEYFSDGLSEELINLLAKIPELKVIGRASSFAFKGKNEDLRTIGQKLGVAYLLDGSVRKDGNMVRVTAELIKASDGSLMWNDSYDRDMDSIFKLQDEIAQVVTQKLKLKLLEASGIRKYRTNNIEAYNLILQGNYFYDKLDSENVAKAIEFYYKALAIDSTDVATWVCLTNAISRQSWQNYIDQRTGYEKARQTALKAIALDPGFALGYSELADIKQYYDFDWEGAEKNYQIALGLDPSNADILNSFGDVLHAQGRYHAAEQYHRKALEFNPLKPLLYMSLASDLSYQGKFAEAIPYFRKVLEIDPKYQRAHLYIGRNFIMMGKPELALEEIQKENMEVFKNFGLAGIYFALKQQKEADEKLNEFIDKYQHHWRYLIAQLYAFRNEKEKALNWLDSAYKHHDSWLWWIKNDPWLKNIQHEPRYNAILKKMNLGD